LAPTSGLEPIHLPGTVTPVQAPPAKAEPPTPATAPKSAGYFDFDSFMIRPEFQELIDQNALFLQNHRSTNLTLQGHTDERGSREYNLALGQKRAESVRRTLLLIGAGDAQIEAVSFGAEKPAVEGSNEAAWARNRRVEFHYR
jgi:peptidoglycan-associated lipoprotein